MNVLPDNKETVRGVTRAALGRWRVADTNDGSVLVVQCVVCILLLEIDLILWKFVKSVDGN